MMFLDRQQPVRIDGLLQPVIPALLCAALDAVGGLRRACRGADRIARIFSSAMQPSISSLMSPGTGRQVCVPPRLGRPPMAALSGGNGLPAFPGLRSLLPDPEAAGHEHAGQQAGFPLTS